MNKKILACLLSISMVFTFIPFTSFADTDPNPTIKLSCIHSERWGSHQLYVYSNTAGTRYIKVTQSSQAPSIEEILLKDNKGDINIGRNKIFVSYDNNQYSDFWAYIVVKTANGKYSNVLQVHIPPMLAYSEDFQAYAHDTNVNSSAMVPLTQVQAGTGDENQKIITEGDNNFLSLTSSSDKISEQYITIGKLYTSHDKYYFEGKVRVTDNDGCPLLFYMKGKGTGTEDVYKIGVIFKDGKILTIDEKDAISASYPKNKWCHIKIDVNPENNKYAVYMDDKLLKSDLSIYGDTTPGSVKFDKLVISTGLGKTAHFDDLKLLSPPTSYNEPKELSIEGLNAVSREYDGTRIVKVEGGTLSGIDSAHPQVTANFPKDGMIEAADVEENKRVYIEEITLSGDDHEHYTLTQPIITVNITPAPLTIKPKDFTIKVGNPLPTPEIEYQGLKGQDTVDNSIFLNSGSSDMEIKASDGSKLKNSNIAGTYDIVFTGSPVFEAHNYNISVQKGKLTIVKENTNTPSHHSTGSTSSSKPSTVIPKKEEPKPQPVVSSFSDVSKNDWYYDAIAFLEKKNITKGTGSGKFSPNAPLSRGQFIVMLMRAYEINPDANATSNFTDAGDTYYTNYLATAKRLGISAGVGDNKFAPNKTISRQELFTLLYNALKITGKLPKEDAGKHLSDFTDESEVANWAKDAMRILIKNGAIAGSDGMLNPTYLSTRAQMAQILYNSLNK